MADSNGDWGQLAQHDDELAGIWDAFDRLPDPGQHPVLDAFVERKRISIAALVRLGARLSDAQVLAFPFPGGLKYRDMVTGRRWNYYGSEFTELKLIPSPDPTEYVLVCEGETDGARLSEAYPAADVAIMPAGALRWTAGFTAQLAPYRHVLVALDNDDAGNKGAAIIVEQVPNSVRFAPPEGCNDWCDLEGDFPVLLEAPEPPAIVVWGRELLTLEVPDVVSWYEHAVLPVGGQLLIHGWAKSFKSFLAFDMMSALAQGQDWACLEPTEEPTKVCVIQFEIPWPFYRQRCAMLRSHAPEPELWDENFGTWQPLVRPTLAAGNTAAEDLIIGPLVDAGVQVVLIDPVRRAGAGIDFNDEKEVRRLLGFFERLQREGITVVATHHDRKADAKSYTGDIVNMTGAGAFAGDADSLISVYTPRGTEHNEPRRNLHFTLRNAPAIGDRGFEIVDDRFLYSTVPHGGEDPDTDGDTPPI